MFFSIVLVWLCICIVIYQLKPRRPKNFPPGPPVLPFLGNLLHLSLENPLKDLERLYGDVHSLYIGPRRAVVLNGLKAVKEAIIIKGADFAGRPQDMLINVITKCQGVVLADYGAAWKEHRRFSLMTLRNFGLGKNSMEERILGELQYTIKTLEQSIGKTLSPQVMFHNVASNVICQVLFGTRFEYNDEFIRVFIRSITENTKILNGPWAMLYDSLPIIQNLPLPFRKVITNYEVTLKLLREHKATRVPGDPRDLVDAYLDELEKVGDESSFSEEQLVTLALDLLAAGTDTTSNTLLSAFLHLLSKPHIQEKCQQEIDRVLEGKEQACYEDRHNMPYIQAVIHEAQRMANTVPLSVFHHTTKDTELMGYSIPKGTIILENLSSVLSEEGQWKSPHEFTPENFLNEKGEFFKPEAFIICVYVCIYVYLYMIYSSIASFI
uniref:Cytochrome P450, family 2, subfamily X, polypeptide 9 n=1 Tax=Salarias fasciatus TaxID=181472 RepID=A0A672F6I0_SALFA